MKELILHSFEAGRIGKPDELDTSIANLLGAYLLDVNKNARFDLRVSGSNKEGKPLVTISGEVSDFVLGTFTEDVITKVVLDRYNYVQQTALNQNEIIVQTNLKAQSSSLALNDCSGDSGNPIAVAYANTPHRLPWERYLAVEIRDILDGLHLNTTVPASVQEISLPGLRADGKIGVDALYDGAKLERLESITIATEHEETLSVDRLRSTVTTVVYSLLNHLEERYAISFGKPQIDINTLGGWHRGGWEVDDGSREAKPYRDSFSTYGVQEDSFSGEDGTKPSGTGTFLARHAAVRIVEAGLADFARVALRYVIGKENVGVNVFTNGTGKISQEKLHDFVRETPLRIKDGIERFGLQNSSVYKQIVTDRDYFHNPVLPWNRV